MPHGEVIELRTDTEWGEAAMPRTDHHPIGLMRREFIQVGFSGLLGLTLPDVLAPRRRAVAASPGRPGNTPSSRSSPPQARSVILVFLTGGLSHIDSFDMKPEAPEG